MSGSPRVFDCFAFVDEFLLLKLRLTLLAAVVDRFVLVESTETFQGSAKRLEYLENRDLFREWQSQIVHVVVDDLPRGDDPWAREWHQRRAVMRGLAEANERDVILIEDADEIPDPRFVESLRQRPPMTPVSLELDFFYYCFDLKRSDTSTAGKACLRRDLDDDVLLRRCPTDRVASGAGWHFSWLDLESTGRSKLESFSHVEFNKPSYKTAIHLHRCRRLGVDLFGREVLRPIDLASYPRPLVDFCESEPQLVHGARGLWETALAHCYRLSVLGSIAFGPDVRDDHPIAAFLLAIPIAGLLLSIRGLRRAVRSFASWLRRDRRRPSLGRSDG